MRVITANIHGLKNALELGFFDWLTLQNADVVCLQELNCPGLLPRFTDWLASTGYNMAVSHRSKKTGGTAILSRSDMADLETSDGTVFAPRGQYAIATVLGVRIACIYVALGNDESERSGFSERFDILKKHGAAIICGDFNIIHGRRDSEQWYHGGSNGYRDDEREWFDALTQGHWTDALRSSGAGADGTPLFTWWNGSGDRFDANKGTRLDYQLTCPEMTKRIVQGSGHIFRERFNGKRISDHGPITIDYTD